MTVGEAKAIDLAAFVACLGHAEVVKGHAYEAWFLSPLRLENTPSFVVDRRTNRWKDFGASLPQGDIVDLVLAYGRVVGWEIKSFSEALDKIESLATIVATAPAAVAVPPRPARHRVTSVGPVVTESLLTYLRRRGLNLASAGAYLSEVHYVDQRTDREYYGLGWRSRSGGIETRNAYIKLAIGPKDISVVRVSGATRSGTTVFEGMMDFLSYVQLARGNALTDAVILNGVGLVGKAIAYLRDVGDGHPVQGWLQNDEAGRRAAERLAAAVPAMTIESQRYAAFNDLNDYLVGTIAGPAT